MNKSFPVECSQLKYWTIEDIQSVTVATTLSMVATDSSLWSKRDEHLKDGTRQLHCASLYQTVLYYCLQCEAYSDFYHTIGNVCQNNLL